ncbi:uncharacterized protein TNCV_1830181 [Trichonephila clavipes]|nr:uncharacterized protein TNCV_1830181 [Trichonephila clavipes]
MAAIDVDASFRSLEDCFENLENVLNCAGNPSKSCVKMQELLWEDKDRFLTAIKEKANTLKVSSPKKRNPNVLLKNLPNEISDHDVLQLLKDQNPELEEKVQFWEETKNSFHS